MSQTEALRKSIAIKLLLDGLHADGAHHKQYYLEKALEALVGEAGVAELKNSDGYWEEGQP